MESNISRICSALEGGGGGGGEGGVWPSHEMTDRAAQWIALCEIIPS